MPYSNSLYSLSDNEDDYADQLSPSDGYFASSSSNVVPDVPNVWVSDPTLQQRSKTDAESKTLGTEAHVREETALNTLSRHSDANGQTNSLRPEHRGIAAAISPRHQSNIYPSYNTSYTPSSSAASASRQPLRSYSYRGRTPSAYSEAPPAYSPSPLSPLSPTSPNNHTRSYSTFTSNMGASIENQRLLGPESMGQIGDEEQQHTPRWNRRIRRRLPPWLSCRTLLLTSVLLVVSIGFLASSYRVFQGSSNESTIKPQIPSGDVERPPQDPQQPIETQPPSSTLEPFKGTWCKDAQYRFQDQIMSVTYGHGRNFSFVQDQHSHDGKATVKIGGQINLRRLDSGGYPRVVIESVTNDKNLLLDVHADPVDQYMRVSVPKKFMQSPDTEEWPCVEMRATIWVPKGGGLQVLSVAATHLDVLLLDDLNIKIDDYSKFTSVIGDVSSAIDKPRTYENQGLNVPEMPDYTFVPAKETFTLDSRIVEVTSSSGKIEGNWPLYDMLGLHNTAGNIDVSVTPKPVLESAPKPAVLSMTSVSGSIHATEPIHAEKQMPIREYWVDVKATSGGIHGAFAFSSGCELKSTASDIAVDLLPVIDMNKLSPQKPAQLETVTTSGTTAVRIMEPIWFDEKRRLVSTPEKAPPVTIEPKDVPNVPVGDKHPYEILPPASLPESVSDRLTTHTAASAIRPFDCLQAIHKSTSAEIGLRYPQSWAGNLEAETTSGNLSVQGKDVQITKSTGGWGSSKISAYKGKNGNASTIQVRNIMGGLDAVIGFEK